MAKMYYVYFLSLMFVNIVYVNSYDTLKQHSPMYVDKTNFLEAFYTPTKSHRCIFLTAPPGFGKTAIVSMVDQFSAVEIESDNVSFKPALSTETFKIFKDAKVNLSLKSTGAHLAQHIVLRLAVPYKFESVLFIDTLSFEKVFQKILGDSANRYETFLNTLQDKMREEEYSFLKKLSKYELSRYDLPFALRDLIIILHKYSNRSIILLIDDYDFAAYGITHRNSNKQTEAFYKIFNAMINYAIKLSPKYVHKAMITSTYSLPFYWSGETGRELGEFHHYEFLKEHVFTEFIGFSETEVRDLAKNHSWDFKKELELAKYCNGYLTETTKTRIFKPKCIENYIHFRLPANVSDEYDIDFRSAFRDLEYIKPYVKECDFEIQLLLLSYNETIPYPNYGVLGWAGIKLSKFAELQDPKNSNKTSAVAYKLLWNYLKEYGLVSRHENSTSLYRAPNQEALRAFQEFVFYYHDESQFPLKQIAECLQMIGTAQHVLGSQMIEQSIRNLGELLSNYNKNLNGVVAHKTHELIVEAILFASTLRTSWKYFSDKEVDLKPFGRCAMYLYNKQENVAAVVNVDYQSVHRVFPFPNFVGTEFPHPGIGFLTYLTISVKKPGSVEVSHVLREIYIEPTTKQN